MNKQRKIQEILKEILFQKIQIKFNYDFKKFIIIELININLY